MTSTGTTTVPTERELAGRVLVLMPRLGRVLVRSMRGRGGLSIERVRLLRTLDRGSMRIGEIARRWDMTAPSISQLADPLESDGLVHRAPDPDDRRAVALELTAYGRKELRRFESEAASVLADVLRNLPHDARTRIDRAFSDLEAALDAYADHTEEPHGR